MSNPKIKIEADLSSFESQLSALKTQIASVGDQLKTATGRTELNFGDSQKILNDLVRQYDKLTASSNKSDLSSKKHLETLKQLQKVLTEGAKVSAKVENLGDRNSRTSEFFNNRAESVGQSITDVAIQRDRDRTVARLASDRETASARTMNRMGGMAGTAIGAITGGGGIYSAIGANIGGMAGGMAGGPIGMIAGQVLGAIGGVIDSNLSKVRDEQKAYSELFRMIGTTSHDFSSLQNSVRAATSGLTITAIEAGNLAKSYVKLTGSDDQDLIARTVRTAASVSQSFGIGHEKTAELLGNAKLYGQASNSADLRRIMLQVSEHSVRGGGRLEEVLTSLTGMIQRAGSTTFTSQNIGDYASLLASGSSLPYAGIKNNPSGVAALINQASSSASGGGGRGEASQEFIQRALYEAFPGVDPKFHRVIQEAGIHDNLGKIFEKDGNIYNAQGTDAERAEVLKTKELLDNSRFKDLDAAYQDRVKRTGGNSMQNLSIMGGLYGMSPSQAAIMMQLDAKGRDGLEKKLGGMGIDGDTQQKYAGQFAELFVKGNTKEYFGNLVKNGRLSKEDQANGEKLLKSDQAGFEKFVYSQVAKQPVDAGLGAQLSEYELQKKISENITGLVTIGTESKKVLIGILDFISMSDSVTNGKLDKLQEDNPLSGKNAAGGEFLTKGALGLGNKTRLEFFNNQIRDILKAKPGDKKALYDSLYKEIKADPEHYPAEAYKLADDALKQGIENSGAVNQGPLPADTSVSSIPLRDGLTGRQKEVASMVMKKSKYDSLFKEAGLKYGLDPLLIKQTASWESNLNPSAFNQSSNDFGMMQHNKRYFAERGLTDSNWSDPRTNIFAGARLLKQNMDQSNGDLHDTFKRYNGWSSRGEEYADSMMGTYNSIHDQLPKEHTQQDTKQGMQPVSFNGNFTLSDIQGRQVAPPINVSRLSRPRAYSA